MSFRVSRGHVRIVTFKLADYPATSACTMRVLRHVSLIPSCRYSGPRGVRAGNHPGRLATAPRGRAAGVPLVVGHSRRLAQHGPVRGPGAAGHTGVGYADSPDTRTPGRHRGRPGAADALRAACSLTLPVQPLASGAALMQTWQPLRPAKRSSGAVPPSALHTAPDACPPPGTPQG